MLLLWMSAWAGPEISRESLERVEELLEVRLDDGRLSKARLAPAMVVSTEPRYVDSVEWYPTAALESLVEALGASSIRLCQACMQPRVSSANGRLEMQSGPMSLDEIASLDAATRGAGVPAKTAIWLDETSRGVSIRIVDLSTGELLYAQNVDPTLDEVKRTQRTYSLAAEYERRAKGLSLTQVFVDLAIYPGQHISLDWTDQFGKRNDVFAGFSVSLFDPVVGVGAVYYRRVPFLNILLGGKFLVSIPTALANNVSNDVGDLIDPMVTLVGVVRVPIKRSNYGAVLTISTNGRVALGLSLLNVHLIPVVL